MPAKQLELPAIGTVKLYKRRGVRAIKLTVAHDNHIRVTLPLWVPYKAGLEFVKAKRNWITAHQKELVLFKDGQQVGKAHRLWFTNGSLTRPASRVTRTEVRITIPTGTTYTDEAAQLIAKLACIRALRQEAVTLLPMRLRQLASNHGFSYSSVKIKRLKARWGSCNHRHDIALNLFLMRLPWELIDYVLLHELTHTKHLSHNHEFWAHMESCMPDVRLLRKQLREYQPVL